MDEERILMEREWRREEEMRRKERERRMMEKAKKDGYGQIGDGEIVRVFAGYVDGIGAGDDVEIWESIVCAVEEGVCEERMGRILEERVDGRTQIMRMLRGMEE